MALYGSRTCIELGIAKPITCNAICPGHVKTRLIKGQIKRNQAMVLRNARGARRAGSDLLSRTSFFEVTQFGELAVFRCSPAAISIADGALPIERG
jgi:3-hydroxybutyrate dehydrogenase